MAGDPNLGSLVVGEAVGLAARLELAAGPGEILLGRRLRPGALEPVNLAELEPRRFRRC